MAPSENVALMAVVVIAAVVVGTSGNTIRLDESKSVQLKPTSTNLFENFYKQFLEYFRPPTVEDFATNTLCKNMRRQFVHAMTKKLWSMHTGFVKKFVHKLCEKRPNNMLKLWVAELFDSDGNGYIDNHEKNAIIDTNDVEEYV